MATPMCADRAAYAAIPEPFLECIMTRRHAFPPRRQQHPQHVRMQYDSRTAVLELTEFRGTCGPCGTVRLLYRDRYDGSFMWAEYTYPDGYLAPAGTRWDPELIREEYDRRFPVKGKVRVVTRP
jgi:hypothetical protein